MENESNQSIVNYLQTESHDITKNLKLRVFGAGEEEMIDIRFYLRDMPTKRGVRLSRKNLNLIFDKLNKI